MENQKIKSSPRDILMHLLLMALLYVGTFNFIHLLFEYINKFFPDPLSYSNPSQAIRWPVAILVIIFPVYLWAARFLNRDLVKNPEKSELKIRKWFIYITLFLAGVLIIGDLVSLIFNFLEGDLSARFVSKVVIVLAVAGLIFRYYFSELRRGSGGPTRKNQLLIKAIVVVIGLLIVAGFFVSGSPLRQRLIRFDERRLNDLQTIQWQIVNYWQNKNKLPAALSDLEDSISGFIVPIDPKTDLPYEYNPKDSLAFELCAVFGLPSDSNPDFRNKPREIIYEASVPAGPLNESWAHPADRHCFERTIDPDLYRLRDSKF